MLKFKSERIEREFDEIDSRLRFLLYAVSGFIFQEFKLDFWVTHLIRTQEEQDEFYASDPRYVRRPWLSVHQFGCGGDGRVQDFTPEQIEKIDAFLDQYVCYNRDDKNKQTSVVHNVGFGNHIHIQVKVGKRFTLLRSVLPGKAN